MVYLLFFLVSGFASAAQVVAHLPEKVEVGAGTVRLSQIASLRGDADLVRRLSQVVVARVEQPGTRRMVSASALKGFYLPQLQLNDTVLFTGATRTELRVRSRLFPADSVKTILRDSLRARLGEASETLWELSADRLSQNYALPEGKCIMHLELEQHFRGRGQERATLVARCGEQVQRHSITFVVRRWQNSLVLKEDVPRGATLRPENVEVVRQEVTHGNRSLLEDVNKVGGRIALRTLRKGTLLSESHLEIPWRVRKGEPVRIMAQVGNGVVSVMGMARENGLVGQVIPVENSSTRQVVHARVDDRGALWVVN